MPKSNGSKEKRRKTKKKQRSIAAKIFITIFKIIFWLILLGILLGVGLFAGFMYSINKGAGELSKADFEISKFTTYIYDKDGNEYTSVNSGENRTYASLSEVSPYLPKAFIAIEDERFDTHPGIDVKRTTAATVKFIMNKLFHVGEADFGGSTITQQVIKKVTGEEDRSALRKAREIVRAIQLEKWLSKDQIIELYMNLIYLGEGAYGVETAAYTYFDKSAADLTIAECAVIGGLAQAPEGYNPYNYPEKTKTRQLLVLNKMYECGYISSEQLEEAKNQELVYKKGSIDLASSNSYFIDAVIEEVISDLQEEKGITRQMAQKMVYNNGLKIYTTLDPKVQNAIESVYTDNSYFTNSKGEYDPDLQSAMVIIDYKKGEVVGLVGGAGEKTTLRGLNRATQSKRAPGSNIKPLAVYGAGLEKGTLTAATVFDDVPTTIKVGNQVWRPSNYDYRYRGLTTIRKAIECSINVMAVKAFQTVGTDYSFNFLKKLGITTLTANDRYPAALALGGLTDGIIPLEMAGAYGTIANGGVYIEPKLYTKVVDRYGDIVIEKKSAVRDVMSKENAYILTNMMMDVTIGSEGTARNAKINNIDTAGKTGTTSSSKDRWFSAFTPYYVGSVWVGYDIQKTISTNVNPSSKIWKAVMEKVHDGLPAASFTVPAGVQKVEVCRDSGLLATDACKSDRRGSRVRSEYFNTKNGTIPTTYCTTHEVVQVCPDTFKLANPTCLHSVGTVGIVFLNRHYETPPSRLPEDYGYEVPNTYCQYHYCPVDENGNFIEPSQIVTPIVDEENEIKPIENNEKTNSNKANDTKENKDDESEKTYIRWLN